MTMKTGKSSTSIQEVVGDEAIVVGCLRIIEDRGELLQVAGPKEMVDVGEGCFRKQANAFGLDGQNVLPLRSCRRRCNHR
jgi:hypothetical protein